jgi:hypothetical protein
MTTVAESRDLPGWPKKKLVTQVRRQLASFGVRPSLLRVWSDTWQWASQITNSYVFQRWPLPSEIAAQYMLLLLVEMQANHALKLPYRAAEQQPESVRLRLTARRPILQLEDKKESNDGPT